MRRERRKNIRVEWHSPGKIYDCDGALLSRCVIKDFSNGGAKVTGVAVGRIPEKFILRIARGAIGMRKCHVLWRSATTLGVEFADSLPRARQRGSVRAEAEASRQIHA
ncbi:MAG: PilZ domain-containing protein [Hyphomicrobiales bacterium]|nr:PilZ domain-containing protein [Hyphomicrobiales bacterium]MBV9113241.1 PilZ domain-containing protein [Hyphomicrobiales bacterium]